MFKNFAIVIILCLFSSSCAFKQKQINGYSVSEEKLNKFVVGKTTIWEVKEQLGSPMVEDDIGGKVLLYIQTESEFVAFLDPKPKEYIVTKLSFNDNNVLTEITNNKTDNITKQKFADDKTETKGDEVGALHKLLGSIGKFNKKRSGLDRISGN
jgi:outer membrane protein assembly factor BamE (lipoprotein component of BamABCDE complex)